MIKYVKCGCGHFQAAKVFTNDGFAETALFWAERKCNKCQRKYASTIAHKWGTPIYTDEGATIAHAECLEKAIRLQREVAKSKKVAEAERVIIARAIRAIQRTKSIEFWRERYWEKPEDNLQWFCKREAWIAQAEEAPAR